MIHRRTYVRSVSALAFSAGVAGCSGEGDRTDGPATDEGGGTGATESPADGASTATTTPTPDDGDAETSPGDTTARSEYPDYTWDQLDDATATATTTVDIGSFTYDPLVARVPAGEEISFPNTDSVAHTVTAPALDVDASVESGEEATIAFDDPGTYDYVCKLHPPDMLGRLVVEEGLTVDDSGDDPDDGGSTDTVGGGGSTDTSGGGGGTDADDGDDGGPAGPY